MSGSLTHSPAEILKQLLVDLGHGTAPSDSDTWPVFVSRTPDSSATENCLTIYDTTSQIDGRSMTDGAVWEHHGIQIRVRHALYNTGYSKARQVAVALDEEIDTNAVSIDGSVYIVYAVSKRSGPLPIGDEPKTGRKLFTINAVIALRQTT